MSINKPTHQAILKNYRVSGDVYNIGTRGGRVSFYSQQLRAIQLASAFANEYNDKEKRVLVVGGGIAGVTFLTALRVLGFEKVEGYEAQDRVLQTQNSAMHRDTHPSANDWPMLLSDREFCSTTNIPFLNWFADNVADVLLMIRADENFLETEQRFSCGRIVRSIEVRDGDGVQVRHQEYPNGLSEERIFDVVVCAVGFGVEANLELSKSGSYWWSDHLKHYRTEHQNYHSHRFYISGTGDGGLIDFSRACLAAGNSLDGEEPNPAWALIGKLRRAEYLSADNVWPTEDERCSEIEAAIAQCFQMAFEKAEDEGRHPDFDFPDRFSKLVRDFRPETTSAGEINPLRQIFDETRAFFRRPEDVDRVILLGQFDRPYSAKSSPANALLAGFLIEEKPDLRYKKGKVTDKGPHLIRSTSMPKRLLSSETTVPIDGEFIHIARNGSEDRLPELFEDCPTLKKSYRAYVGKKQANDFILTENFEEFSSIQHAFTHAKRRDCAEKFFHKHFPSMPDVDLVIGTTGQDDHLEVQIPRDDENVTAAKMLGGFDKIVFGLAVSYRVTEYTAEDFPVFE